MSSSQKKKINPWGDDHPEKLLDSVPKTIGLNQQLKRLVNPASFLDQMFGVGSYESPDQKGMHEYSPRTQETLVFSRKQTEDDRKIYQETNVLIHELKKQITVLQKKEKNFSKEIAKIKVQQIPKETGIYYLHFFDWLISQVRQLTLKIEDSCMWLQTFNAQKKKKIGYWQKYKKHGTTFGLSHERSLATQTG